MRSPAATIHIAALAPFIKAGLVTREAGNAVVACWDSADWKPGHVEKGKWYPAVAVEPVKAIPTIQSKPKTSKKVKKVEPEIDDKPDMFAISVRVEAPKKWLPRLDEIY
jgi:hypothetical protein